MSTNTEQPVHLVDVLIAALRADGIAVGDAEPRDEQGRDLTGRFAVVYTVAEHAPEGSAARVYADRRLDVQITSVANTRAGMDALAMRARSIALGPLPYPDGYVWLAPAELVTSTPVTQERPNNPGQPSWRPFYRADLYRFHLTPYAPRP